MRTPACRIITPLLLLSPALLLEPYVQIMEVEMQTLHTCKPKAWAAEHIRKESKGYNPILSLIELMDPHDARIEIFTSQPVHQRMGGSSMGV